MKVHEYQAKEYLSRYGVPLPPGRVARTPEESRAAAEDIVPPVVVKAQLHAGGRGKAGGVRRAGSAAEAERAAAELLGKRLVTAQTGAQGAPVSAVLVEKAVDVARELYLSVTIDSAAARPVIIASQAGGVDIEEVAAASPERVLRVLVDPAAGFQPHQGRRLAYALGLEGELVRSAVALVASLYRAFEDGDCSLAEINPLVLTADGALLALDAKISFDDSAAFRHPEFGELGDASQEDPLELKASEMGITGYVRLEGNIGCVVNGAGLAMATMDIIKLEGGEPANFLDIGTVNTTERVVNAFKLLSEDPQVEAVLVNVFGGITRVDIIAQGIVEARQQLGARVPVVVRLAGTNAQEGERILAREDLGLVRAADLEDAARKVVAAASQQVARGEAQPA